MKNNNLIKRNNHERFIPWGLRWYFLSSSLRMLPPPHWDLSCPLRLAIDTRISFTASTCSSFVGFSINSPGSDDGGSFDRNSLLWQLQSVHRRIFAFHQEGRDLPSYYAPFSSINSAATSFAASPDCDCIRFSS